MSYWKERGLKNLRIYKTNLKATGMQKEHSSFRDRSGFVFYNGNEVYRLVHQSYKEQYGIFLSSGLYHALVEKNLLIPHTEVSADQWPALLPQNQEWPVHKIIQPEKIAFISYPYEWCFQQLKDAALLTLQIQLIALEHRMTLKDASAFNIQFHRGKPVFIDTLSFDHYDEGAPWVAYRQFCSHFLAPLALMSYVSTDAHRLSQLYIDGIPLSLASSLLPVKTRMSLFYLLHIHYHAKLEAKYSGNVEAGEKVKRPLSRSKLIRVIEHLVSGIRSMKLPSKKTEWANYYNEFSYSGQAIEDKKCLVREWASSIAPKITWDLGCNTGLFSELLQPLSQQVISVDADHFAVEKFYTTIKEKKYTNILPLVLDLSNPTAAIGWANTERKSFFERGKADLVLVLAIVHHLAIGNNVPLIDLARIFGSLTRWLIIEFVPKNDEQVKRLLVTREDIFSDYNEQNFESAFQNFFTIEKKQQVTDTKRVLYLMKRL